MGTDKTLVFVYFFLFGRSGIMLSSLISTFFTRAKSAMAVGTLAFLGAFFPYFMVNDEAVSMVSEQEIKEEFRTFGVIRK
ncbi:hypothetical protein HanIR_Chr03g0143451 [Helianthus annuus]|nr:hypothetical protein HanIR_Chr03g0143451 [Helianthus annuus]